VVRSVTLVKNRGGVGQPVLDKVDLVTLGRYVMLFITHFTFLTPPFVLVRTGGVKGVNEGGDNIGGRLGFSGIPRPSWTPDTWFPILIGHENLEINEIPII